MSSSLFTRRQALGAAAVGAAAMATGAQAKHHEIAKIDLDDPASALKARVKTMGSIGTERVVSFLRLHIYGQMPDEPARPMMSMNNLIVGYWRPGEDDSYHLKHYEVGYYTEFDTDEPLDSFYNPYLDKELETVHFVLGPLNRQYKKDTVVAPGMAPLPLRSNVVGDRFFTTTQSITQMPNMLQPEEWPEHSNGKMVNWTSLMTYSAAVAEVADPETTKASSHIQLQNFVSWAPWMLMGQRPGGTMVRACGTHIDGFEALPPKVLAGFKKYTPEIFETEEWNVPRFDAIDYFKKLMAEKEQAS